MATLSKVHVHTNLSPAGARRPLNAASAAKVNALLDHSHGSNHIFFLDEDTYGVNLHNHLAHQALTLFALGAGPEAIQKHHERNQEHQRSLSETKQVLVDGLDDPTVFTRCLGRDDAYLSFISFFDRRIAELGLEKFLGEFVFGTSKQARRVFHGLFYGYLHPLLSVGFGVEFEQAAIVSEGLAQACCHRDQFLDAVFDAADEVKTTPASLMACLESARASPKIKGASNIKFFQPSTDDGKFFVEKDALRDGVIPNGGQDLIEVVARWQVDESEVALKTAELINTVGFVVCAAQRPPYESRFDFFTLHGLTSSTHFTAFLKSPALHDKDVARLLQDLGRTIVLLYVAVGCPELNLPYALAHRSKTGPKDWNRLFELAVAHEDDGHLSKCIRALSNAQQVSAPYEGRTGFPLKQRDFLPLACSVIDSGSKMPMFTGHPLDWIRGAGWQEAWTDVPTRDY